MTSYELHLKSTYWVWLKRRALHRSGNRCERCGWDILGPYQSHLHHRTYERFGREELEDVELLCVSCHEDEHGRSFSY